MEKIPTREEMRIANQVWDRVFGIVYDIESFDWHRKHEGVHYKVKHSGSDEWSCDCPSYKFDTGTETVRDTNTGKRYIRTCKHIRFCMHKEGMKLKRSY